MENKKLQLPHNANQESPCSIYVSVRIRPLLKKEKEIDTTAVVNQTDKKVIQLHSSLHYMHHHLTPWIILMPAKKNFRHTNLIRYSEKMLLR